MGLTGISSWNTNTALYSNITTYNRNDRVISNCPSIDGVNWFLRHEHEKTGSTEPRKVVFPILTDSGGCRFLTFTATGVKEGNARVKWKITKSLTTDTSGMTECQYSTIGSGMWISGEWKGEAKNINLLANAQYYVLLCVETETAGDLAGLNGTVQFQGGGIAIRPGPVTARDGNFNDTIDISFGTDLSGAEYTVTAKVGTSTAETLQTRSTGRNLTWVPNLSTYASQYPNAGTVSCEISVTTFFGNAESGTQKKTIKIAFTAAQAAPEIDGTAFSLATVNTGAVAGMSGYIQGYSKIRAAFSANGVTLKYGASVKKWSVKFGAEETEDVTGSPLPTTKDSGIISATTEVRLTVTDSRDFTASTTLSATITPYQMPSFTATAFRSDSHGVEDDAGTYLSTTMAALYASVSGQNSVTAEIYYKLATAASYGTPVQVTGGTITMSGTNKTYSVTGFLAQVLTDAVYDIQIKVTDSLGNTATAQLAIESQAWALHIRNKGAGAAFGKAAERDGELDIGNWKLTCGDAVAGETSLAKLAPYCGDLNSIQSGHPQLLKYGSSTQHSPYSEGITTQTSGNVWSFASNANTATQIAILCGKDAYAIRKKKSGTWGPWRAVTGGVNPNLIDNWYFIGGGSQQGGKQFPINSRGQTVYNGTTYTVDRFYAENSYCKTEVTASGLKLTAETGGATWISLFPHSRMEQLLGKTLTLSVLTADGQFESTTFAVPVESSQNFTPSAVWINGFAFMFALFHSAGSYQFFRCWSDTAGASVTIAAVKLELGSAQTLAHKENGTWVLNELPDYEEQLLKCQTASGDSGDGSANTKYRIRWELLWTNDSPSSNFGAQTIQLDLSKYQMVMMEYKMYSTAVNCVIGMVGSQWTLIVCSNSSVNRTGYRNANVTTSGIEFTTAKYNNSVDNQYCVPWRIWGW